MTSQEIIKDILEKKELSCSAMASALQLSQQACWYRLNSQKNSGLQTSAIIPMLRYLGYDLVIMPRGKVNRIDGAYLVEDEKK